MLHGVMANSPLPEHRWVVGEGNNGQAAGGVVWISVDGATRANGAAFVHSSRFQLASSPLLVSIQSKKPIVERVFS